MMTSRGVAGGPAHDVRARISPLDRALQHILAEIQDGLRHGYFEFAVTCEVIGQDRRRMVLKAGKTYQFVLQPEDCTGSAGQLDSRDGSETDVP